MHHFPGSKTNLYELGIRLPCIFKIPLTAKNFVQDAMISWVDITPTLLDFCWYSADSIHTQGCSFKAICGQQQVKRLMKCMRPIHFHEISYVLPYACIAKVQTHLQYCTYYYLSIIKRFCITLHLAMVVESSYYTLGKRTYPTICTAQSLSYTILKKTRMSFSTILLLNLPGAKELQRMQEKAESIPAKTHDPWRQWDE